MIPHWRRGGIGDCLVISLLIATMFLFVAAHAPIRDRLVCDDPHPFLVSPLSTIRQDIEARCWWEKSNPPRSILGYYMDRWR